MLGWISRLGAASHRRRTTLQKSVGPRPTLESFEKVKLVPLEYHDGSEGSARSHDLLGDRDKLFLPASFLDDVLGGDGAST